MPRQSMGKRFDSVVGLDLISLTFLIPVDAHPRRRGVLTASEQGVSLLILTRRDSASTGKEMLSAKQKDGAVCTTPSFIDLRQLRLVSVSDADEAGRLEAREGASLLDLGNLVSLVRHVPAAVRDHLIRRDLAEFARSESLRIRRALLAGLLVIGRALRGIDRAGEEAARALGQAALVGLVGDLAKPAR